MQAQDLRLLVCSQILVSPCFFLKSLRTTAQVELFSFQDYKKVILTLIISKDSL